MGTSFRILDQNNEEVIQGESGEMWITGAGVARGYLRRPEKTAATFVTFPEYNGERLYRTGDLGYMNADGNLICQGRADTQVKFRGYRIELGEIETEICKKAPQVEVAIVIVRDDLPGGDTLVAYVKLAEGEAAIDVEVVKAAMRAAIPAYMVPTHFETMKAFPMTPNLKVDRSKLPKPSTAPAATATATATATAAIIATVGSPASVAKAPFVELDPANIPTKRERGFWRKVGHVLATPFREIRDVSHQIKDMEEYEEEQRLRRVQRDAAVQAVEDAVAALGTMVHEGRVSIDAGTRQRVESIAQQSLSLAGSKKTVATSSSAANANAYAVSNPAAAATAPVAANDTSKLQAEISDVVYDATGTRLEGSDSSMEMIGLDSLGSMLVAASLRKRFNVAVAPASIKQHGTSLETFAVHLASIGAR